VIEVHKARAQIALLLSVFLFGCEDKAARAQADKAACFNAQLRFLQVVDAMCSPWSEHRGTAISVLAEQAQQDKAADPDSDPSDDIMDLARRVTAKDCVRFGYPDPGEKIVDPMQHDEGPGWAVVGGGRPRPPTVRVETHVACDLRGGMTAAGASFRKRHFAPPPLSASHP
jgi:hypothetical protein